MADRTVEVYVPVAESGKPVVKLAPKPADLNGKKLGILDNNKHNAGLLLTGIAEKIGERYKIAGVVHAYKGIASPAAPGVLDRLAEQADIVIGGTAD